MKLSVYALPNRHGLGQGIVWDWFREQLPPDTELEILNALFPVTPTGAKVLLMGQRTAQSFINPNTSIFTSRGSFQCVYGLPATATFDLQDAYDFRSQGHDNVFEEKEEDSSSGKDRAVTSKANWPFWIKQDLNKLLTLPVDIQTPLFVTAPADIEYYIKRLSTLTGATLYLDIEVNMQAGKIDCIGLAVDDSMVVVFPIYTYEHRLYYSRAHTLRFLAALSTALTKNLVVVHNAMFDLVYLASELRLPIGHSIYDTMIAQQRCHAEPEKSLGHAISLWTWQPWHKDEGGAGYSKSGQDRYWAYNAKDVWTTRMVHRAQLQWLSDKPDYSSSVTQANASIYPYIMMTLTGMKISRSALASFCLSHAKRLKSLQRILRILTGIKELNPGSTDQLRKFFYITLGYKPPSRTATGKPALGAKQIYQLAIKYDNPVLQVLLHYRDVDKELSMAQFQGYCFHWQRAVELES